MVSESVVRALERTGDFRIAPTSQRNRVSRSILRVDRLVRLLDAASRYPPCENMKFAYTHNVVDDDADDGPTYVPPIYVKPSTYLSENFGISALSIKLHLIIYINS